MVNLYPFQKEIIDKVQDRNRVGFFLDMGLGKTFVGSEKAVSLNKKILVVCQKSKLTDWINHFNEYYPELTTYDLTDKDKLIAFIDDSLKGVGVINYDLVFRRPELYYLNDITIILDESSCIQNSTAKRTKAVLKINASNAILLSGTPVSGKYENLWTQCVLLGWHIKKSEYEDRYINFELVNIGGMYHREVSKVRPYKNIDNLKENLRIHGAIFMKSDEAIDLPEQNFQKVYVKKSDLYSKFLQDKYLVIDDKEYVGDTPFQNYLYKRQLCSYLNKDKLLAFKDLIESTNDRLIVFYNWNNELAALKNQASSNRPISIVNGKTKDLSAYDNEENSITFIQYQAGAMGLNLQKANKIIYASPTDKSELYEQSKKRIHRIGQEKPCFYYQLTVKSSIEEKVYKSLAMRKDYTDYLFEEENEDEM